MKISIETLINASLEKVWSSWITPEDITKWNFASNDWTCPRVSIDLKVGGKFNSRMEAKDGSMGFDFEGTFTKIITNKKIEYALTDERKVLVSFIETDAGIRLVETFDAEGEYSAEQQKQGWQSILENFKKYVENKES